MKLFFARLATVVILLTVLLVLLFDSLASRAQVQPGSANGTFYVPFSQTISASDGPNAFSEFENAFQVNPDTVALTGTNSLTAYSFSDYFGGGATQGGRRALSGVAVLTAPSNSASSFRDYVAGQFLARVGRSSSPRPARRRSVRRIRGWPWFAGAWYSKPCSVTYLT